MVPQKAGELYLKIFFATLLYIIVSEFIPSALLCVTFRVYLFLYNVEAERSGLLRG